jgi:uncharacterized protein YbjT (DUF2867 family)
MRVLLTGANGYIGKKVLPALVSKGYDVVCCVRDMKRFHVPDSISSMVEVIETDFLDKTSLKNIPKDIDGAFYLMHSMSSSSDYESMELTSASNFRKVIDNTDAVHIIYLSGIVNDKTLSKHLLSRKAVEDELARGSYHFTTLRAGIIIGSGSASFEIIRDLVEKMPVMVAPKWVNVKCQPIGIRDVISFLSETLFIKQTYDRSFDIGGPDILTYKQMLLGYAKVRGLRRRIFTVPVMTPRLSSYWLFFVTSTSYKLATSLVSSMKVEVVCRDNDLNILLNIHPVGYEEALKRTFSKIEEQLIISSWKDSLVSGVFDQNISEFINVPAFGCFTDRRIDNVTNIELCKDKIWSIGGEKGWYFADGLWRLRGFIDKVFGGVGLKRGRRHPTEITPGDAIDFWRVLYANKEEGRLLLFAEMKLPGEAWLEFKIKGDILLQTATFRPKGVWGRLYWYLAYPLHLIVFKGMINGLAN